MSIGREDASARTVGHTPAFQLVQVSKYDADVHLQGLHEIAFDVVPHQLLCLCSRQRDVALLQEGRDVPLRDLCLRVHPVLQLAQSLGSEPHLGLVHHFSEYRAS